MRAAIAALVVLLVAGGPIASVAHYVLVAHVVCEHGELVELTASTGTSTPIVESGRAPAVSTGHGLLFGPDHAHCAVAAMARHSATRGGEAPSTEVRVPAPRAVLAIPPSVAACGQLVLSLAPKTSPPQA